MSFGKWLSLQTRRNDRVGDIARDVQADKRSGEFGKVTPESVKERIENAGGSDAAMEALNAAVREWCVGVNT